LVSESVRETAREDFVSGVKATGESWRQFGLLFYCSRYPLVVSCLHVFPALAKALWKKLAAMLPMFDHRVQTALEPVLWMPAEGGGGSFPGGKAAGA